MADLSVVMDKLNKDFKENLAVKGIGHLKIKKIPFTSPRLNYETYGGIPRGRITMFAGKESSGKSTTALDLVKNAQILFKKEYEEELAKLEREIAENEKIVNDKSYSKSKKDDAKKILPDLKEQYAFLKKRGVLQIVYFDAEGTVDSDWAKKLGVDVDNVWLVALHQQTAEQFLDQVLRVVRDADNVGLIIIDSIAVLVPQLTHGMSLEQKSMGGNAAVVTMFCNEVAPLLGKKGITALIINQMRDSMNPYADFTIPCGNGLKLASSVILTFQKGKYLDAEGNEQKNSYETPQGNIVWVRIQKTKVSKPDRRVGFYSLSYDYGVDVVSDIIPMAVEMGVIERRGAWFNIVDELNPTGYMTFENGDIVKFQGMANLISFLRQTPEAYEFVENKVMSKVTGTVLQVDPEKDKEAIADMQEEARMNGVKDDIQLRNVKEDNSDIKFEAPDEIPPDDM